METQSITPTFLQQDVSRLVLLAAVQERARGSRTIEASLLSGIASPPDGANHGHLMAVAWQQPTNTEISQLFRPPPSPLGK